MKVGAGGFVWMIGQEITEWSWAYVHRRDVYPVFCLTVLFFWAAKDLKQTPNPVCEGSG